MSTVIARRTLGPSEMQDDRTFGFATRAIHAGRRPIRRPARAPYRFIRPRPTSSARPNRRPSSSRCAATATSTAASAIRRLPRSRSGWPVSKAGSAPSPSPAAWRRSSAPCSSLAQAGDHVVCTQNVYGGTITQLSVTIKRMGIETTFVPVDDFAAMREAIGPQTRFLFAETVGNPSGVVADIGALAEFAHGCGVPLVIDNTFATPYLCRPIERGADIVLHSATKFLNGHGTAIGGVMVESGTFPWGSGRFPLLSEPSPGLSTESLHRDVRRVCVSDAGARRSAARRRRADVADGRVACASRTRDVAAAHGPARSEYRGDRRVPQRRATRWRGFANRSWVRSSRSACAAAAKRAGVSSTRCSCGVIWPTSATPRAS